MKSGVLNITCIYCVFTCWEWKCAIFCDNQKWSMHYGYTTIISNLYCFYLLICFLGTVKIQTSRTLQSENWLQTDNMSSIVSIVCTHSVRERGSPALFATLAVAQTFLSEFLLSSSYLITETQLEVVLPGITASPLLLHTGQQSGQFCARYWHQVTNIWYNFFRSHQWNYFVFSLSEFAILEKNYV